MSTLRISDAPLLPDVDGTEKIPTGGRGDYAISVDQIKGHIFQDIGKELVGLGNVDNTSDLNKPVSTAQQAALDLKSDKTYVDTNLDLKADKTNVYTRSETSLVLSQKADLVNGVIPESQIPSSFNDVLEFTTLNLPIIGESGKIYVTTDTNKTWRWATNRYVEISGWNPDSVSKRVTLPTYYARESGVDTVTGVADGAYFNVRSSSDESYIDEYQNVGGVATPTGKSYPSSNAKWDASFVVDASGLNQQEINDGVDSIAELLSIVNPKNGSRVFVKSYNSPIYPSTKPFQGGNTFIFDSTKLGENDGVFVFNGWVAVDQELTFEKCGVVLDSNSDQSEAFNFAINYAIAKKVKVVGCESTGYLYLKNSAVIPASKASEFVAGFNELELNLDGVTVCGTSDATIDTLLKIHRRNIYISGLPTFIGGGTVKTAIQHGMTASEYDYYQTNNYHLITTAFKFDNIYFKNIESGLKFIAGTQSYYHRMGCIKGDSVNYLVSFLTSPKGLQDQVTRSYIKNIQHTNGVCTLFCESVETLIVPSLFSEFLRVSSGYTDTLNYVNGVPTAIYIPDVDKNGLSNNRIFVRGVVEYSDLAVVNQQVTNQLDINYTNMTAGDNSIVGISTNNTSRAATTLGIKRLDVKSHNFGTYPINISSSDIAADPSLKNHFPDQSWSELVGTLTFMPSTNQGFANAYNRTELLYVRHPPARSGLYTRTGTNNVATNEKWVKLSNEARFKVSNTNTNSEGYILLFPYNVNYSDLTYFSGKLEVYRGESSVYNASCIYEIEVAQAYQSVNSFLLRKTGNSNIFPELCVVSASGQQYVAIKKASLAVRDVFITINSSTKADYQKQVQSATYVSKLSDAVQYATSVIV